MEPTVVLSDYCRWIVWCSGLVWDVCTRPSGAGGWCFCSKATKIQIQRFHFEIKCGTENKRCIVTNWALLWLAEVCVCVWCVQSAEAESQWVENLMWFHQSRVRDVEWITGLDFYQGSHRPIPDLLRMKTRPTAAIQRKQWNGCFTWKKWYTDSLSVCEGGPEEVS